MTPPIENSARPPPLANHAQWFADEVQPHGSSLQAYLRGTFPGLRDTEDVVQESYLRLWRLRTVQPIRSAKAFLFRVARNIALDGLRRSQASPIRVVPDLAALPVLDGGADAARSAAQREEISLLADALGALPPRCREIIVLRKFHHLSQREVATRLGISELTVQEQVYRGLRRMEKILAKSGVIRPWQP